MKEKRLQIPLPQAAHEKIERIAEERNSTVRNIGRHAVLKFLDMVEADPFEGLPRDGRLKTTDEVSA